MIKKKMLSLALGGILATKVVSCSVMVDAANNNKGSICIAKQGMFSAGGITVTSPGTFNPEYQWEATGKGQTAHVDHTNVFYQIPSKATKRPMVFLHGYGQSRMGWMATPLQLWLLNRGMPLKLTQMNIKQYWHKKFR